MCVYACMNQHRDFLQIEHKFYEENLSLNKTIKLIAMTPLLQNL